MADLSDVEARLAWAEAHARRVADLSAEWTSTAIATMSELDGSDEVIRSTIVADPPVTVALAIGDTLQQCWATLNGIVTALRGGEATRRSGFLVETDPNAFDRDKDGRLAGVPDAARSSLRTLQPFAAGHGQYVGEWIAHVEDLAIIDRHRALLLHVGLIDLDQVSASAPLEADLRWGIEDKGRTLTLRHRAGAAVHSRVGAGLYVAEERLAWADGGYPDYPSAADVAERAVWCVREALQVARRA